MTEVVIWRDLIWCVCENIVNKIHHRTSRCILLVIYIILDLINARKMERFETFFSVQLDKQERRTRRDEGASQLLPS